MVLEEWSYLVSVLEVRKLCFWAFFIWTLGDISRLGGGMSHKMQHAFCSPFRSRFQCLIVMAVVLFDSAGNYFSQKVCVAN